MSSSSVTFPECSAACPPVAELKEENLEPKEELEVSINTLYNFTGRAADQLRPFYEEIREK